MLRRPDETPQDHHSCSSRVPAAVLNSNERVTVDGRVAALEADLSGLDGKETTHFSIRDYAFSLRTKNIGLSWPFPQKYLQVCLKHGVKDLLPPFEPPDTVRAHKSTKRKRSEQPEANLIEEESLRPLDRLSAESQRESYTATGLSVLQNSSQTLGQLSLEKNFKVDRKSLGVTSQDELSLGGHTGSTSIFHDHMESSAPCLTEKQDHSDTIGGTKASLEPNIPEVHNLPQKFEITQKLSQKKCRLVVKLGAAPEPPRTSELSSSCSMVSDSMSSKVCPVCKTFSSTSNTTLNAHIDQCLSVENNTKQDNTKSFKHKPKPIKKRLMVNIYATAARCTLEDLDRRNGTNWALDLSLVSPSNVVCTEVIRPTHYQDGAINDDNEGAVYVDSNGTKLCILSRLSNGTLDTTGESSKAITPTKDVGKQTMKFSNKGHLATEHFYHLKLRRKNKKRQCVSLLKNQVEVAPESKVCMTVNKEKDGSLPQKCFIPEDSDKRRLKTLRPKIRSLQSGKLAGEIVRRGSPKLLVAETTISKSNSGNSSAIETSPVTPKKIGSMNLLSSTVHGKRLEENELNVLKPKSSTFSAGCNSLSRSKKSEIKKKLRICCKKQNPEKIVCPVQTTSEVSNAVQIEDNVLKSRKHSWRRSYSLPSPVADSNLKQNYFSSKKIQTNRALKNAGKQSSADINEVPQRDGLATTDNYQICMTNRSSCLMDIIDEVREESSQTSFGRIGCGKEVKRRSPESSKLEDEHNVHKYRKVELKSLGDGYDSEKSLSDNYVEQHTYTNIVTSKDQIPSYDASIRATSSLEENEKLIGGTEAWVELFASRSSTNQQTYCGDESSNVVNAPHTLMINQQYMEYQTEDAAFGEATNGSLRSSKIFRRDIHQEHSCVTSNKTFTNDEHQIVLEGEPYGSPISAASTISHPTFGEIKDKEPQPSTDEKSKVEYDETLRSPTNLRNLVALNTNNQVQEPEKVVMDDNSGKSLDKQSYCCMHGDHEVQLSTNGTSERPMAVTSSPTFTSKRIEPSSYCSPHQIYGMEKETVCSTSPRSALDASVRYSKCRDFRSYEYSPQIQSECSPTPVLRLMGKNLMIVNNDEKISLKKEPHCSSKNFRDAQYPHVYVQSSMGSIPTLSDHRSWNPRFNEGATMKELDRATIFNVSSPSTGMQMGTFLTPNLHKGTTITDLQVNQARYCKTRDSPFTYNMKSVATIHDQHQELSYGTCLPTQEKDLTLIHDSQDMEACPRGCQPTAPRTILNGFSCTDRMSLRPISCIPSQCTYGQLRELQYDGKPCFSVSCPRNNVRAVFQGNQPESVSLLLSNQFVVPSLSTNHLRPHFYSPTFRQWQ